MAAFGPVLIRLAIIAFLRCAYCVSANLSRSRAAHLSEHAVRYSLVAKRYGPRDRAYATTWTVYRRCGVSRNQSRYRGKPGTTGESLIQALSGTPSGAIGRVLYPPRGGI